MELDVFEIYAILIFYFILKWVPIILIITIVLKALKNIKEQANEKLKEYENMVKGQVNEK